MDGLRCRRCGNCGSELRYAGAFGRDGTPEPTRPPSGFAAFVRDEYSAVRRRWPRVTHARVMQELGRKWARRQPPAKPPASGRAASSPASCRAAKEQPGATEATATQAASRRRRTKRAC